MQYEGYCATFQVDREGDRFVTGCFTFATEIFLLYEHHKIIGTILNIMEDPNGLWVQFTTDKFFDSNKYFLSIGFISLNEENILYRNFKKVKVHEVSIVKQPAQFGTFFTKQKGNK